MKALQSNYSAIDRMVHRLAMSQFEVQKLLSRLEDRNFDRDHGDLEAADPVFITSLPRAGTTLLLEIVAGVPQFAAHTYRDMPFLLCPLTWDRVSKGFRKQATAQERAHGDGMLVSYDSVEAFEEIIWRAFWPEHFEATRIRPWSPQEQDEEGEFTAFLRQHMRKIIGLGRRRTGSDETCRYVSKNNANIARLNWLEKHFPDARILIPYRAPAGHIRSLVRQHQNFLEAHDQDAFVLHYMETIGHLEFGKALRPIDFDNWLAGADGLDPNSLDFWVEYWIVAFEAMLAKAGPNTVFFSYDHLCTAPEQGLRVLEGQLRLEKGALAAGVERLRAPTRHEPLTGINPDRNRRLQETLARLESRALF